METVIITLIYNKIANINKEYYESDGLASLEK